VGNWRSKGICSLHDLDDFLFAVCVAPAGAKLMVFHATK
jgi:hypothetical protein